MNVKKILVFCLALIVTVVMAGCGGGASSSSSGSGAGDKKGVKIGVAMPTKSLQRWNQDGSNMEAKLKEKGYDVDLQFAENKVEMQVSQIENMITKGCKVIIVGAIDGGSLSSVLDEAKSAGCKVISYDRLIMNTDAVSYYATFDNYGVGKIQGQYIEEKLGLKDGKGPFNFEITTGPLDDNNVVFFYKGAMDVLQPYIDKGQLVVKSGQVSREQCATPSWDEAKAQERMDNILTTNYTGAKLDAGKPLDGKNLKAALNSIKDFDTGGLIGVPITISGNSIPVGRVYRADMKAQKMVAASDWIKL